MKRTIHQWRRPYHRTVWKYHRRTREQGIERLRRDVDRAPMRVGYWRARLELADEEVRYCQRDLEMCIDTLRAIQSQCEAAANQTASREFLDRMFCASLGGMARYTLKVVTQEEE